MAPRIASGAPSRSGMIRAALTCPAILHSSDRAQLRGLPRDKAGWQAFFRPFLCSRWPIWHILVAFVVRAQ